MKILMLILTFITAVALPTAQGADNVKFDGTLVADPCSLSPDSGDVDVDFRSIADKYLYQNTRTPGQPFTIHLIDCDPSLGSSATITFMGDEDRELSGLLAVPTLSGIAIGIETAEGAAVPLNRPSPAKTLSVGNNDFSFSAYVQAIPSALQNHTISRGDFSAIATFEASYP